MEPEKGAAPHPGAPALRPAERQEVEDRSATSASVVHETIRKEGEEELARPSSALAWSGLAAGLSMGFSLVAEGLLRAHLSDAAWRPLLAKLGYSVGFVIVILGRQQLFTENTVTVILPLLTRRDGRTLANVVRLWVVVLLANVAGALLFAWVAGLPAVFDEETRRAFGDIAAETMRRGALAALLRGIFAGWLLALMVWLLPLADAAKVFVIVVLAYLVGLGGFNHIVAGSTEALYGVFYGDTTWTACIGRFMLPTLAGNILGGVSLVAALNHAQVVAGEEGDRGT